MIGTLPYLEGAIVTEFWLPGVFILAIMVITLIVVWVQWARHKGNEL
jgi:hypothetical protein